MVVRARGSVPREGESGESLMSPIRCSYGNTVYRCQHPTCHFDAWGSAVNYHEWMTGHTLTSIGYHSLDRHTDTWQWYGMDGKRTDYPVREAVEVR